MRHLAKTNVPLFLKVKRSNKSERQARRLQRTLDRSNRKPGGRVAVMNAFGSSSKILHLLAKGVSIGQQPKKGKIKFLVPNKFSLQDNPVGVLKAIKLLAAQLLLPRIREVLIDMSKMESYDLAANGLLDVLVEEARTKAKHTGHHIHWHGRYPMTAELRRRVQAMGVIKHLKILHEYPKPEVASRLETFEYRCKNYVKAVRLNDTDEKSRITKRFVDHVNACLKRVDKELIPAARGLLSAYIGEVIDNAEQHSGMYDWTIQGYLDTNLDPTSSSWVCEICIFNFGKTMADTFDLLPVDDPARNFVQPYLDAHEKKGFFSSGWCRDRLLTIIALQKGVSSKPKSPTNTRGFGTYQLITFFMKIQEEFSSQGDFGSAMMSLVSGKTRIIFDGKYRLDKDGRIAFNADNDLHLQPDPQHVVELDGVFFPGTLLSIKYPITLRTTSGVNT
jgi:hypothetical protein